MGEEPSPARVPGAPTTALERDRLAAVRGYPAVLRCDNQIIRPRTRVRGDGRLGRRTGRAALHPTGEPWRNGYIESFNARVRDECLNINIFWSLAQARVVIRIPQVDQSRLHQCPASARANCEDQVLIACPSLTRPSA
jgi:putative transposase